MIARPRDRLWHLLAALRTAGLAPDHWPDRASALGTGTGRVCAANSKDPFGSRSTPLSILPQLRLSTIKTPVWVSHATRNCRKAAPFTDIKSTMANNNLALSKRPRNIPTPNETVCASTAAARTPHTLPCTTDNRTCLHTTVNSTPEPTTLRRLTFCDVQRCLRVLSGARHQQPSEGMGASPAAAQKPELHWQPHDSLRLTSTSPEPP
eukprot:scaffold454_cov124-Isochrysis_galbana.AAC.12